MRYSLDTSAFLDGWRRYYPPKTFESLWNELIPGIIGRELVAIDRVRSELRRQDDDAYKWTQTQDGLFVPTDKPLQLRVREIVVEYPELTKTYKGGTRSGGDPFVIAFAEKQGLSVVTGETLSTNPKKPKIPNVCHDLGIRTLSFLELIQEQGWTF